MEIILSICIATFNRANFISATLESIIKQVDKNIEIVIVDGASKDNTSKIIEPYLTKYSFIRYYRESKNLGVDRDYNKAVNYSNGKYVWLMTDDDLVKPGAIKKIIRSIINKYNLIIINSEIKNLDMSRVFEERRLKIYRDKVYNKNEIEKFFIDTADYLSFIGSVVIRRDLWKKRDKKSYYGSLFIHVGVIFQHPAIHNIKVLSSPQLSIRYGNAMWKPKSFEVWMFNWPKLIWSFKSFSDDSKKKVCLEYPFLSPRILFQNRAQGHYSFYEFRRYIIPACKFFKIIPFIISVFPAKLANLIMISYYLFFGSSSSALSISDLLSSPKAHFLSNMLHKWFKRT